MARSSLPPVSFVRAELARAGGSVAAVVRLCKFPPPGGPVPTEAMAKKVFENLNKDDLATGYVRLLTVRKTNGVSTDHGGVKGYTMDCKLEFEFLKNWTLEQDPFLFIRAGNKNGKCVKGEKMAIKREVHFEKSEKGWRWGNLVVE